MHHVIKNSGIRDVRYSPYFTNHTTHTVRNFVWHSLVATLSWLGTGHLCHVNFVFINVYEWITLKIFQNCVY